MKLKFTSSKTLILLAIVFMLFPLKNLKAELKIKKINKSSNPVDAHHTNNNNDEREHNKNSLKQNDKKNTIIKTQSLIDLDINSNNKDTFDFNDPQLDAIENSITDEELAKNPGCVFGANDSDEDEDDIIDCCDGFNANPDKNITDDDQLKLPSDSKAFTPMRLAIGNQIDKQKLKNLKFTFSYQASDPILAKVTPIKNDEGKIYNYECSAPIGFRIWTKNIAKRNKKSVVDGGDFIPSDIELSASQINMTDGVQILYIEAVTTESTKLPENKYIKVSTTINGKTYSDTIRVTPTIFNFVTRGENDNDIVISNFIGVCDPRPEIKLQDISKYDFQINQATNTVNITLKCDEILDPVADNVPRGGKDMKQVHVFDNDNKTSLADIPVFAVQAGKPAFWRQYPYRGKFNDTQISIPLKEGTHHIKVESDKNLVDLTGYDDFYFDIVKKYDYIPRHQLYYNIVFKTKELPTNEVIKIKNQISNFLNQLQLNEISYDNFHKLISDINNNLNSLQNQLAEKNQSSFVFFQDSILRAPISTDQTYTRINDTNQFKGKFNNNEIIIEINNLEFTENIDSFEAEIPIGFDYQEKTVITTNCIFTETSPFSKHFIFTETIPTHENITWSINNLSNALGTGKGTYYPFTARVLGLPPGAEEKYDINLGGTDFKLKRIGSAAYSSNEARGVKYDSTEKGIIALYSVNVHKNSKEEDSNDHCESDKTNTSSDKNKKTAKESNNN